MIGAVAVALFGEHASTEYSLAKLLHLYNRPAMAFYFIFIASLLVAL